MFRVSITSSAERDLKRLDRTLKNRIVSAVLELATAPRPPGCVKVRSEEGVWRIRVGDWRVGYRVDDSASEVLVIKIAHRSEFYR